MSYPLISFCMPVYNHAHCVVAAIDGALAQTYPNLEIIISDDSSTDNTWEVVNKTLQGYDGPHKIRLNRNAKNLGITGHVNKLFELASSDILVMAAGDDVSAPDRVEKIASVFLKSPDVCMVSSEYSRWYPNGIAVPTSACTGGVEIINPEKDLYNTYFGRNFLGATLAYRKCVFTKFGELSAWCKAEDVIMIRRAMLTGKIGYIREPLVKYRIEGGASKTRSKSLSQSVEFNRMMNTGNRQMLEDYLSTGREQNDSIAIALRSRISESIYYIEALSSPSLFVRIKNGFRYLMNSKSFIKKKVFVFVFCWFPLRFADRAFGFLYTKNLAPS